MWLSNKGKQLSSVIICKGLLRLNQLIIRFLTANNYFINISAKKKIQELTTMRETEIWVMSPACIQFQSVCNKEFFFFNHCFECYKKASFLTFWLSDPNCDFILLVRTSFRRGKKKKKGCKFIVSSVSTKHLFSFCRFCR